MFVIWFIWIFQLLFWGRRIPPHPWDTAREPVVPIEPGHTPVLKLKLPVLESF